MEFGSTLNSSTSNLTSSMRCDDLSSILKRSKEDNDDLELKDKEITTIDTNLIKDLGKIHLSRSVTDLTESNSILPSSPLKNEIAFFKPSTNSPKRRRSPDHFDQSHPSSTPSKINDITTPISLTTPPALSTISSTSPSPYTTPPHVTSSSLNSSPKTSPESPSLLSRRAALGTLPNKTLVILQQMRFAENHHLHLQSSGSNSVSNLCQGLGVGPGTPGFEGLEGLSPLPITTGLAGQAFRAALGLDNPTIGGGKDGSRTPPVAFNPKNENGNNHLVTSDSNGDLSSSILASSNNFFIRSPSANNRRRLLGFNSTASPTMTNTTSSDNLVKIPPSLRGSRILDTLNLSPQSPNLSSPRLITIPPRNSSSNDSPTNSPISRSSAFNYFTPLTPLTPSHVPNAPSLPYSNSGGFEWSSYSMPDSPSCPLDPNLTKSIFESNEIIPRDGQSFFLPGSGSGNVGLFGNGSSNGLSLRGDYLPGSPLKERPSGSSVGNPFF